MKLHFQKGSNNSIPDAFKSLLYFVQFLNSVEYSGAYRGGNIVALSYPILPNLISLPVSKLIIDPFFACFSQRHTCFETLITLLKMNMSDRGQPVRCSVVQCRHVPGQHCPSGQEYHYLHGHDRHQHYHDLSVLYLQYRHYFLHLIIIIILTEFMHLLLQ